MRISVKHIQETVAEHFELPVATLSGRRNSGAIVEARHVAMFFARDVLEKPYTEIARRFNREDHTTVLYACKRVKERSAADPTFAADLATLREVIGTCPLEHTDTSAVHRRDQLEWCPEEYRDWYQLLRKKGFNHPESRKFIQDQIATDIRRAA